jgi:hypothetical protein
LSEIYEDVGADINGDIIFYRELWRLEI